MAKTKEMNNAAANTKDTLTPAPANWDPDVFRNFFKSRVGLICILIGVPLAVRVLHLLSMLQSPLFQDIIMIDADWYHQQGVRIALGEFCPPGGFFRPPFYTFFLGFIYALFRPEAMIARLFQLALGSANCFLTFKLGERFFSRKVAWIGWAITAFYGPLVFFDAEILLPVWVIFFNLMMLLMMGKAEGETRIKPWALAGLFLGLSSITRANILPFLPAMICWLVWRTKRWWDVNKWLIPAIVAIVLALLPGTIIGLRNMIGYGEFMFIAHQGGLTSYVSNNPEADGLSPVLPGKPDFSQEDAIDLAAKELGVQNPSPDQVAEFYSDKTKTFIKENPGRFVQLTLKRFYYYFSSFEGSNNVEFFSYSRHSIPLKVLFWHVKRFYFPSGILIPLALCGIVMSTTRWRRLSALYLYVLFQLASFVFFFIVARFRLPVIPIFALFAGQALSGQWGNKDVTKKQKMIMIVLFIVLLAIVNADPWAMSTRVTSLSELTAGLEDMSKGDLDKAQQVFEEYLQVQPTSSVAHGYLAAVLTQQSNLELNEEDYKEAAGKLDEALDHAERAVQLSPKRGDAYKQLADVYRSRGHFFVTMTDPAETEKALKEGAELPRTMQLALNSYKDAQKNAVIAAESAEPYTLDTFVSNMYYRHAGVMEYLARTAKEVRSDDKWKSFAAEGEELIDKTLKWEDNADHRYLKALFALSRGDREEAIAQMNRALELDIYHPDSTKLLKQLEQSN